MKLKWLVAAATLAVVVLLAAQPAGARQADEREAVQAAFGSCWPGDWAPWCWDWSWLVGGDASVPAVPAEPVEPQPSSRIVAAAFSAQRADGQRIDVTVHLATRQDLPFQERDDQLDQDLRPGDLPVELVQGNQYKVAAPAAVDGHPVSHWLVDGQRTADGQAELSFQAPFGDGSAAQSRLSTEIVVVYA